MKHKGLSLFLFLMGLVLTAHSSDTQPVNSLQLFAWLTAGVPCNRLVRLMQERGMANSPGKEQIRQFESAGADKNLIRALKNFKVSSASGASKSAEAASQIPKTLLQAAAEARAQRFHEAELDLRKALNGDSQDAALHFALAAMLRQQEQWDDAFDEVEISAKLMPDFPENHSAFAYIFYRLDDGPNAIAEARTALEYGSAERRGLSVAGARPVLESAIRTRGARLRRVVKPRRQESRHLLRSRHYFARRRQTG